MKYSPTLNPNINSLEAAPVANESADPVLALARAERQLRELRAELAMRDMLGGRSRVCYDDLTAGEVMELQTLATRFLNGMCVRVRARTRVWACMYIRVYKYTCVYMCANAHAHLQKYTSRPCWWCSAVQLAPPHPTATIRCPDLPPSGAAPLEELPLDSLKRIREMYKAFKAVAGGWSAAAAAGDGVAGCAARGAGVNGGCDVCSVCSMYCMHCMFYMYCMCASSSSLSFGSPVFNATLPAACI